MFKNMHCHLKYSFKDTFKYYQTPETTSWLIKVSAQIILEFSWLGFVDGRKPENAVEKNLNQGRDNKLNSRVMPRSEIKPETSEVLIPN